MPASSRLLGWQGIGRLQELKPQASRKNNATILKPLYLHQLIKNEIDEVITSFSTPFSKLGDPELVENFTTFEDDHIIST